MNKLISFLLLSGLCLASCKPQSQEPEAPIVKQPSLAGKIYISSEGMDSVKCERIELGTDYFQRLIFVDDSTFIQIISTCCPDYDEDFASDFYYSGTYKLTEKELLLDYAPLYATYYTKESMDTVNDSSFVTTHVEMAGSEIKNDNFDRRNCHEVPYFIQKNGDFKGEAVAPNTDRIEDLITELKERKVWEKLFEKK